MTTTAEIADFALGLDFADLREDTVEELKKRVLDSLGIAVAAMDEEPVGVVGDTVAEFGGEGSRYEVETKAQADHSLPYMLAAALVDRELGNAQYEPERIRREDVQELLEKVDVVEDPNLTTRFEDGEMPAIVEVEMTDGTTHFVEKDEFEGHPNDPMSWDEIERKFHETAEQRYDEERRDEIIETVRELEDREVSELVELLD